MKFWVGNSGNWDDTAHWALSSGGAGGAGAPTSSDDVIFDSNSFTISGQVVTIRDGHAGVCKSLDASNALNLPTLKWNSGTPGSSPSLTVINNVTIPAGTFAIQVVLPNAFTHALFEVTSTSTFSVHPSLAELILTVDGAFTLGDDLVVGSITQTGNTFSTNNHNLTLTSWTVQQGTLNLGSSTITQQAGVGHFAGLTGLVVLQNVGNVTLNAGTSNFIMSSVGGEIEMLSAGGNTTLNFNNIHFTANGSLVTATTGYHLGFNNFTADIGVEVDFTNGTFFVNGTLTASGGPLNPIIFSGGGTWFINSPTNSVNVTFVNVKNSHASGITPFVSSGGVDLGGNLNWSFTAAPAGSMPQIVNTSDTTQNSTLAQLDIPSCSGIADMGIVYSSTNTNPTIADSFVPVTCIEGPYTIDVSGLIPGQTYYLRTYTHAGSTYAYGTVVVITTPITSAVALPATDNLIGPYQIQILDGSNNIICNLTGIAYNFSFSIIRNRPEEISFTVPLRVLENLAATLFVDVGTILATGVNTIRIQRKNSYICAGQLDYWEVDAKDPTDLKINIKAHGWLSLLSYRVFSGEYQNKDANFILRDIITQTQLLTNGNFGMTLGASIAGTNLYVDKKFENKTISDIFIEASEEGTGIDFDFTWDKILTLYWPAMGTQRQDILFTYPGNVISLTASSDSTKIVNSLLARGKGNATANVSTIITDGASQLIYKLRTSVKDYPDTDANQLVNLAASEVAYYKNPLVIKSLTYSGANPACPDVGTYKVGDSARFIALGPGLLSELVSGFYTIDKQTVTLDENGVESVQLDFNTQP
jgi:hypothetical protein